MSPLDKKQKHVRAALLKGQQLPNDITDVNYV